MQYNVYDYSNQVIGQVEANDATEAWSEAGKRFSGQDILDVRSPDKEMETSLHRDLRGETLRSIIREVRDRGAPMYYSMTFDYSGNPVDWDAHYNPEKLILRARALQGRYPRGHTFIVKVEKETEITEL